MNKNLLILLATSVVVSTSGYAEGSFFPLSDESSHFYAALGFSSGMYSDCTGDKCEVEDTTYGVIARAGYNFNKYVGIEGRIIATLDGEEKGGGQKLKHVGLFLKPMYPFGGRANAYGLIGYGKTKGNSSNKKLRTVDDSGLSAGVGVEYVLDKDVGIMDSDEHKKWSIFVDYQRLLIKDNAPDTDVISAGAVYAF